MRIGEKENEKVENEKVACIRLAYTVPSVLSRIQATSASGLNCRYLNPYIKLKLTELAIKL